MPQCLGVSAFLRLAGRQRGEESAISACPSGESLAFRIGMSFAGETTMLRFNQRQRDVLIDKLPDLANVIAGALTFGQALSGEPFSAPVALTGIALWAALGAWTIWIAGEE